MKNRFVYILLFTTYMLVAANDNNPFTVLTQVVQIENPERSYISYEVEYLVSTDYIDGEIIEKYDTDTVTCDLSVYILNQYKGKIFFNDYMDRLIGLYDPIKNTVEWFPGKKVMIGFSPKEKYFYTYNLSSGATSDFLKYQILLDDKKLPDSDALLSNSKETFYDYTRRLYYIKHVKKNRFVFTMALDEDVTFFGNIGWMYGDNVPDSVVPGYTEKDSLYPVPERSREPLPCGIYVLDIIGPVPAQADVKSKFTVTQLPLDLKEYGVQGEIKEDSPFKIHQLVDYSTKLKKYAFIGRDYEGEKREKYIDYLYLVKEKGGRPEPVLQLKAGKDIEDMIFSPDGKKLVLDINGEIYILTLKK